MNPPAVMFPKLSLIGKPFKRTEGSEDRITINIFNDIVPKTKTVKLWKDQPQFSYIGGRVVYFHLTEQYLFLGEVCSSPLFRHKVGISLHKQNDEFTHHQNKEGNEKNGTETYKEMSSDGEVEHTIKGIRHELPSSRAISEWAYGILELTLKDDVEKYPSEPREEWNWRYTGLIDCDGQHFVEVDKEYLSNLSLVLAEKFRNAASNEKPTVRLDVSVMDFIEFLLVISPVKKMYDHVFRALYNNSYSFDIVRLQTILQHYLNSLPRMVSSKLAHKTRIGDRANIYLDAVAKRGLETAEREASEELEEYRRTGKKNENCLHDMLYKYNVERSQRPRY